MHRIIPVILLSFLLATAAFAQQSLKVGSAAPAFSGTTMDGSPVNLKSLEGKVVVMTFWSTRCAICHYELPKLSAVTTRFDPTKVVFLALSMENEEKIAPFLKKNPYRFDVIPNSFATVLQYADRDRNGNLDMGFPAFFVIDRTGKVQHRASGYDKSGGIEATVTKLLGR